MPQVILKDVTIANSPLPPFSLEVDGVQWLALTGPAGGGAEQVLRAIAGLEPVSGGAIAIGKNFVEKLAPARREVGVVFADDA